MFHIETVINDWVVDSKFPTYNDLQKILAETMQLHYLTSQCKILVEEKE
jgi:hypothetical protein